MTSWLPHVHGGIAIAPHHDSFACRPGGTGPGLRLDDARTSHWRKLPASHEPAAVMGALISIFLFSADPPKQPEKKSLGPGGCANWPPGVVRNGEYGRQILPNGKGCALISGARATRGCAPARLPERAC